MKPIIYFAILFFGLTTTLEREDNPVTSLSETDFCEVEEICFQDGEVIEYDVFYNAGFLWFNVGRARFMVKENSQNYYFTAIGATNQSYEWAFPVKDTVNSVVNKESFQVKRTTRVVNEGNYSQYDHMSFDYSTNQATSDKGKSRSTTERKTFSFPTCARDILTTLYVIRGKGVNFYKNNPETQIKIVMDQKIYPIDINYLGIQKVRIRGYGNLELHTFNPELIASTTFKETDKMRVYVSQDKNTIPLMLESPISVGKVRAVLRHTNNLKYPSSY